MPTAYTTAIAAARVSSGKISLTVRYAALAPALAKKNIADQHSAMVVAVRPSFRNSTVVAISSAPLTM